MWFIGVEPGGGWKCSDDQEIQQSRESIKEELSGTYSEFESADHRLGLNSPIAIVSSKIATQITPSTIEWREYRADRLWLKGSQIFNGNLMPIAKASLSESSWPSGYKELLGLSFLEYKQLEKSIIDDRAQAFQELIRECRPQAIVCFGVDKAKRKKYKYCRINDDK